MYAFENLNAWKESRKLVVAVYQLLDQFPKFEKYALCDQIRRAIVSVPSNLAEGSGRTSPKEQLHFYEISYGSLMESYNQLICHWHPLIRSQAEGFAPALCTWPNLRRRPVEQADGFAPALCTWPNLRRRPVEQADGFAPLR